MSHMTLLMVFAAAEHGPGSHGPVVLGLLVIAVLGGVIYLVRRRASRPGSGGKEPNSERDGGPHA